MISVKEEWRNVGAIDMPAREQWAKREIAMTLLVFVSPLEA